MTAYERLRTELRERVGRGEYRPGDQFLTERQVAVEFGVRRITANKVLAGLVSEGLLEVRKGLGTFVRRGGLDYNLRTLESFTAMVEAQGRRARTRVLRFREEPRGHARLGEGGVYFVERLRLADGVPVILERRWFLAALCPGLRREELAGSLYALWREKYFLALAGAEQTIRAVNMKAEEARRLGVREGDAGLLNESTGYLEGRRKFWWEETLYRGDQYEFFNRLGAVVAPGPSVVRLIRSVPR